jgi:hypothetical protein
MHDVDTLSSEESPQPPRGERIGLERGRTGYILKSGTEGALSERLARARRDD